MIDSFNVYTMDRKLCIEFFYVVKFLINDQLKIVYVQGWTVPGQFPRG